LNAGMRIRVQFICAAALILIGAVPSARALLTIRDVFQAPTSTHGSTPMIVAAGINEFALLCVLFFGVLLAVATFIQFIVHRRR